ncbi:MAG: YiiD C-terminal domain-containing protein [Mucilaginibacter sp.]|nr:YiiD C-terminal domain-containing protein [Mucilaginibacter sp.]
MVLSETSLKWIMRFYPPLLFQRIWIHRFYKGFRGVEVKVFKSIFNKNYNGTIFGGTIFAAADPCYPVLFDRILKSPDRRLKIWSKSSKIDFLKPANSSLTFKISITDQQLQEALAVLNASGKYENTLAIDIFNVDGEICVSLQNEVYIRDLNFKPTE